MSNTINAFQVDNFQSVARRSDGTYLRSYERPTMSFDYDVLTFTSEVKERTWNGQPINLTEEEVTEVQAYVDSIEVDDNMTEAMTTIHNSRKILESTDWYVIRKMDTGAAIPDNIQEMRAYARELIDEAKANM